MKLCLIAIILYATCQRPIHSKGNELPNSLNKLPRKAGELREATLTSGAL